MTPETVKKLAGFQRTTFTCNKCKRQITVETDYVTSASAVEKLHTCKKVKN